MQLLESNFGILQDCDSVNTQADASIEIVSGKPFVIVILTSFAKSYTNHIQIIYISYLFLICELYEINIRLLLVLAHSEYAPVLRILPKLARPQPETHCMAQS